MKNKIYIMVLLLILVPANFLLASDYIDSLTLRLFNSKGKDKVELLNQIAKAYRDNDNDKLYFYAQRALHSAKIKGYKKEEGDALMNIGIYYISTCKYDQGELYIQNALDVYEEIENVLGQANANLALGRISKYIGDLKKATIYYHFALDLSSDLNNEKEIASLFINLGNVYDDMNDKQKALECYLRGLNLKKKYNDQYGIANAYNNIGQLYYKHNEIDKSLDYYYSALKVIGKNDNKKLISSLYNNIALIYMDKDIIDSAFAYQELSLKYDLELNDNFDVSISYLNLGNLYMIKENYIKADEYFNKSKQLSEYLHYEKGIADSYQYLGILNMNKSNYKEAVRNLNYAQKYYLKNKDVDEVIENYNLFSESYNKMGKGDSAFAYFKLASSLNDSLSNLNNRAILEATSMKYEAEKIIEHNNQQEVSHKADMLNLYKIIILCCLLILVLAIGVITIIRKNKLLSKANMELEEINDFQRGAYYSLINNIRPTLFPLSINIAKLNHLKEYEDLNKSYVGIASELEKLVKSYKDYINN